MSLTKKVPSKKGGKSAKPPKPAKKPSAPKKAVTEQAVKIESGIAAPEKRSQYPYKAMKVGDSFHVICDNRSKVYVSASAASRRLKKRFTASRTDRGVRVWRVS